VTTLKPAALNFLALLLCGLALNVVFLGFTGAILERKFELRQHFLEAQRSPPASEALAEAFCAKDVWGDFVAVPIIGCLIGAYAELLQRRKSALLVCLLPMFAYEVLTQPVRTWPVFLDAGYLTS
jgi:hypothetical protein